jgi:hypothetical protein
MLRAISLIAITVYIGTLFGMLLSAILGVLI